MGHSMAVTFRFNKANEKIYLKIDCNSFRALLIFIFTIFYRFSGSDIPVSYKHKRVVMSQIMRHQKIHQFF